MKLLLNPDLAAECGIQVPATTKEVRKGIEDPISVFPVRDRSAARAFIGFKHVNGPHSWDSFAKGRFAADWYAAEKKSGVTVKEIARSLGDRHDTVLRLVHGIYVLDQSESEGVFSVSNRAPGRQFYFSHLYTALTRPGIREYLGLERDWRSAEPRQNPVPKSNIRELGQLMLWLFGSDDDKIEPIIRSQNPDIKQLSEVLQNPIARKEMLARNNLKVAYREIEAEDYQLEQSLVRSYRHAEDAQSKLSAFAGDDDALVEVAARLEKASRFIHSSMVSARRDFLSKTTRKREAKKSQRR